MCIQGRSIWVLSLLLGSTLQSWDIIFTCKSRPPGGFRITLRCLPSPSHLVGFKILNVLCSTVGHSQNLCLALLTFQLLLSARLLAACPAYAPFRSAGGLRGIYIPMWGFCLCGSLCSRMPALNIEPLKQPHTPSCIPPSKKSVAFFLRSGHLTLHEAFTHVLPAFSHLPMLSDHFFK